MNNVHVKVFIADFCYVHYVIHDRRFLSFIFSQSKLNEVSSFAWLWKNSKLMSRILSVLVIDKKKYV